MYNLPWIVAGIMRGLEAAYVAAVREVEIPMGKQREARHSDCALDCAGDPYGLGTNRNRVVVS